MNLKPAPQDAASWLPAALEVMDRNNPLLEAPRVLRRVYRPPVPTTRVPTNELGGLPPKAKAILVEVAEEYRVSVRDLRARSQLVMITMARQAASYRLIAAGYSYAQAGGYLGGRGHDTVFRACRAYELRTKAPRVGKRHNRRHS